METETNTATKIDLNKKKRKKKACTILVIEARLAFEKEMLHRHLHCTYYDFSFLKQITSYSKSSESGAPKKIRYMRMGPCDLNAQNKSALFTIFLHSMILLRWIMTCHPVRSSAKYQFICLITRLNTSLINIWQQIYINQFNRIVFHLIRQQVIINIS